MSLVKFCYFHQNKNVVPAIILDDMGEKYFKIRTSEGQLLKIKKEKVLYVNEKHGIQEYFFEKYLRTIENFSDSINLVELWEAINGDTDEIDIVEACELLTGSGNGHILDAFMMKILKDTIYFTYNKKNNTISPNSEKIVNQRLKRIKNEETQKKKFKQIISEIQDYLGGKLNNFSELTSNFLNKLKQSLVSHTNGKLPKDIVNFINTFKHKYKNSYSEFSVIKSILKDLNILKVNEDINFLRYHIKRDFPQEVTKYIESIDFSSLINGNGRKRITDEFVFTIDDESTTDRDDAISVERVDKDHIALNVYISDPAEIVIPNNILWETGRRRGNSIYHPTGKVSMLPPVLSEDFFSFNEQKEKLAILFRTVFDSNYNVVETSIEEVIVTVDKNYNYEEVDKLILSKKDRQFDDVLKLAENLKQRRLSNGAVILKKPELNIFVNEKGEILIKRISADSVSRMIISEFMIHAGSIAGDFFYENGLPAIYRVQNFDNELSLPVNKREFDDIVEIFEIIKKLKKAEISTVPDSHSSLGIKRYVQITSPLRRFQDLILHFQLKNFLKTGRAYFNEEDLLYLFKEIEDFQARNSQIQNDAKRYYVLKYINEKRIKKLNAVVLSEEGSNFYKIFLQDFYLVVSFYSKYSLKKGTNIEVSVKECYPDDDILRLVL